MAPVSPEMIVDRSAAFLDEVLTQQDLRRRILAGARRRIDSPNRICLQVVALLSQHLDSSHSSSSSSSSDAASAAKPPPGSAFRTAEKLLLTLPSKTAASSLLSALVHALRGRKRDAASSLLDLFAIDPSPARYEFAALFFEDLFIPHLLPAIQWFVDERSRILASSSPDQLEGDDGRSIDAAAAMSLLSRVSGSQEAELKVLEEGYESVLDENTRSYACYLREVLEMYGGGWEALPPPVLVLTRMSDAAKEGDEGFEDEDVVEDNTEEGNSEEPEPERRVPWLNQLNSRRYKRRHARALSSDLDDESYVYDDQTFAETQSSSLQTVYSDSSLAYGSHTPPKDFICPITSNLFSDPVTLETGHTYERKAIQEWIDLGNCTCPITRQELQSTQLPKTNYVFKRLIESWVEHNGQSTPRRSEDKNMEDDLSPTSVFSQASGLSPTSVITLASMDTASSELHRMISRLCLSEALSESEVAVLQIEEIWRAADLEPEIQMALSEPAVVNGFVEILFNSMKPQILRSTVFLLTELASRNKSVIQKLAGVESDVECVVSLFKNGLVEAVVLIYLLNPSQRSLVDMEMLDALILAIKSKEEELEMCLKPRTAALILLSQMLRGDNRESIAALVDILISEKMIEYVIHSSEANLLPERMAAIGILLKFIGLDGTCRNIIAEKSCLSPVLESFNIVNVAERFEIVQFLAELVKLNRRTFNERLLYIIKDGGSFSMMHSLLVYLQAAPLDQSPVIASLLLQLDVLVEPKKMSIYREEAIDALISCLRNHDFPRIQLAAAETILSLQGRYSCSGRTLAQGYLLKRAGMNKSFLSIMEAEQMGHILCNFEGNQKEENAAEDWERRIAFTLVTHEFGLLFEVLSEGLKSTNPKLFSACLISASWLAGAISILPDMGIQGAARVCLLKQFIGILMSSRDIDDKALAMMGLRSFMHDPEGLHDLSNHSKNLLRTLWELKDSSVLACEMLNLLKKGQGHDSSMEMWNHTELAQVDCSTNGEVLSIICFKNRIISGHSDGCIKVWSGMESILHPIQESHEHSKAVTSLVVSGDGIYSGSLDKTVKVWALRKGEIHCTETHDVKDPVVSNLSIGNTMACFISQGYGVKLITWNGGSKLLNAHKNVQSVALANGKIFCGCQDSSIQEIDLATGTVGTVQAGNRKLLGKANPIHITKFHDGLLYTASSSLPDCPAVKIRNASNYNQIGSLPSSLEVKSIEVGPDFIYLGCRSGALEIWTRDNHTKIATLHMAAGGGSTAAAGAACRVQCMAIDGDGELLVAGSSEGKIQAWGRT